jgi:peptidoglycan biosynthesis protein MviN/MurJ (putative lipid II flippase)
VGPLGFQGLALATSIAALVNGLLCLLVLRDQLGGIDGGHLARAFAKIVVASAAMSGVVVLSVHAVYGIASTAGTVTQAARLGTVIAAGLLTLGAAAWALRIDEFGALTREASTRVRKLLDR